VETGEGHVQGGVLVVVWGRESRSRGEGGQETDRFLKPGESVDTDARTDKVWLLSVQRKLYQWSRENSGGQYRELWGWITDRCNLRFAWPTVATGVKYAISTLGIGSGKPVSPLQPAPEEQRKMIDEITKERRVCEIKR
jgi:hypothetical protein